MNVRTLWLAVALGASPLVANAQISANVSFNWSSSVPDEAVASVDVFYDQLAPYGVWIDDPTVGQAFIPEQAGYVPYQNGHWENTDVGFVWISDEPFAWATSHYGRWWFSNDYGRWVWVPDTTWGPSWVDWYESDNNIGWAPLAPDVVVQAGYEVPLTAYHYCPAEHVLDRDVTRYYEPRTRVEVIHRQARPIGYRTNIGSHQVIAGPQPERLAAHRVRATQVRHVEPKQLGRMPATELRAAEQRAQQRKPQIEQQNARRLQAHTEIQKVVKERSTKAPARPNPAERTPNPAERTNERQPNPRVNDVDRAKEQNQATPNAATPRPDVNRREDRTPANRPEPNRAQPKQPDVNRAEPNRAEPNRAEPNRAEPNRAEPNRAEPNRAQPKQPDVNRAEPKRAEPNRTEPNRTEPNRAEPNRTEPNRTEPNRAEPNRTEPNRAQPKQPDVNRAEPNREQPKQPDLKRAEPNRAEPKQPDRTPARPEPNATMQRPEPARPEPKATMPRPEPARPEPPRAEPVRPEPKAATPRPEPQRAEPARPEPHAAPARGNDKDDHHKH